MSSAALKRVPQVLFKATELASDSSNKKLLVRIAGEQGLSDTCGLHYAGTQASRNTDNNHLLLVPRGVLSNSLDSLE